jgi:putative ABC transport system permease protein
MQVQTTGRRFEDTATTRRFFRDALEAVRRVPGVESAALTTVLPLTSDTDIYGVQFEVEAQPENDDPSAFRYAVSGPYIETMQIPLKRGRVLDERDRDGAARVALLNESYAARRFPGLDPIGRRFRIGPVSEPITIVGIVGDVKQTSLAVSRADAVYMPVDQWPFVDRVMSLAVRAPGDIETLVPAIRAAVWSVDKDQAVVRVATMDDLLAASAAERRFALILFEAFALAALVLATAGIYGVLAGSVAERTREIGVRSALGATRADILTLILRQGLGLTGLGVALGLVGAVAASEWIAAMLFGVSRLDPVTYLGVIALLTAASLMASGVPAWRAARVDPARTLRGE